ncbi:MAG: carnitine dehydratase [Proteobacteria bacterium]|nr:carnitine dehydratase [Pseudomonadota bacterium]
MKPLEGVTVLALEQAVAAPFATRQLADLGARVIKIERPKVGDFARSYDQTVKGQSSHFIWLNRSKESLTIDLKHSSALEILDRLIGKIDVFIQNLAPGAVERLGLSNDRLKKINPNLIICNISGYGSDGPYSLKKAYDLLIQCESGVMSVTGTEETPSKAGISIADIAAGMYSYSGILTALYQKERNGKGSILEVSMLEALGEWMGFPAYFTHYGGDAPPRTGASHATIFPYGPFLAGDKKSVFLGIQNEREWRLFCAEVLEDPKIADDQRFSSNSRRVSNKASLTSTIDKVFSKLKASEIIERLDGAQIANARLNSVDEFWNHPQLKARKRWKKVDTPKGEVLSLIPPVTMDKITPVMNPIPSLGSHTESILVELGFTKDFVKQLYKDGAI